MCRVRVRAASGSYVRVRCERSRRRRSSQSGRGRLIQGYRGNASRVEREEERSREGAFRRHVDERA